MTIWVDAQLSPGLAPWIRSQFSVSALPVRELGLRDASDDQIFNAARSATAIVMTKDSDFVRLLERHGAPPQVVWLTCGNTSEASLRAVLESAWPAATRMLLAGEPLVEIGGSRAR